MSTYTVTYVYIRRPIFAANDDFRKKKIVEPGVFNERKRVKFITHGAILYNEAEVFSMSITTPNGRPMLPFDWFIHSSLILASCHRILFLCRFSAAEK